MKQLTILSGSGINLGISNACPEVDEIMSLTYQKISKSVYSMVDKDLKAMFDPDSFDYILGGLLTINLTIEKTKGSLVRFKMNEKAFSDLFQQSKLQESIAKALDAIENQLTISVRGMIKILEKFDPAISAITEKYDSINYFTVNFDGIFDHVLYGKQYKRTKIITDFWWPDGKLDTKINRKLKIYHLHGDIRYKPFKKTKDNKPPYKWPLIVVGDQEVKMGIITSNESLRFYNNRFRDVFETRGSTDVNNLAIIGFGFRDEDRHIVNRINHSLQNKIFDSVNLFDIKDRLSETESDHSFVKPSEKSLISFIASL